MRAEGCYDVPRNEEVDQEADLGNHTKTLTELLFKRQIGIDRGGEK